MSKQALTIIIVTFITMLGWVSFEIYHSSVTTTIDPKFKNISALSNFFDSETLDDVESKQTYDIYDPFLID